MKSWKWLFLRLLLACVFGAVVGGMALSAGRKAAEGSVVGFAHGWTRHGLTRITLAIAAYRQKNHALPRSLSQLKPFTGGWTSVEKDGTIHDGWGRPFVYTVQGNHYLVVSYGRDGKPGGTGWDMDLTSDNPRPMGSGLTLRQFLTMPETQEMVQTALGCGLLAAVLCFMTVRPAMFAGWNILRLAIGLLITLGASTVVAGIITALHVPSGH